MPAAISNEKKQFINRQVFAIYAKYGFDKISMDEVAAKAHISKATLYKYFRSKEDIVSHIVHNVIANMDSMQFTADKGIGKVLESIQGCYCKAILVTAHSGSAFMNDLQNKFPVLHEEYLKALKNVQERFQNFYNHALKEGYCRDIYIHLIAIQMRTVLPEIINSSYPARHNVSLETVMKEYYRLLLCQLLNEKYLYVLEQETTYAFSKELAGNLENILFIADIK